MNFYDHRRQSAPFRGLDRIGAPARPESPTVGGPLWYVVMSRPQQEAVALLNLERQGFVAFLPQRLETTRSSRGFRTRMRPVFPRYLLVQLDLERDRWRSVNGTFGVSRLIGFAERPSPLPGGVAETLQRSLDGRGVLQFEAPLVPGETVRLVSGPFASQLGVLERLDDNGRVRLLLDILGGKIPLSVSCDQVERVTP